MVINCDPPAFSISQLRMKRTSPIKKIKLIMGICWRYKQTAGNNWIYQRLSIETLSIHAEVNAPPLLGIDSVVVYTLGFG